MSAAEIAGPVPDDVQSLTPSERKVYYRHLMISLVDNLTWGLSDATLQGKLVRMANGNFAAISDMNSVHWAVNATMQLVVSPIGGAAAPHPGALYHGGAGGRTTELAGRVTGLACARRAHGLHRAEVAAHPGEHHADFLLLGWLPMCARDPPLPCISPGRF
jgi:hypothetical protein